MGSRPRGTWVRLNANAWLDAAIVEVGPSAELMFYRSLQYAAANDTGGRIARSMLRQVGRNVYGLRRTCDRLAEQKLWICDEDADEYLIRNFAKYNPEALSDEDIAARQERDRLRKQRQRRGQRDQVSQRDSPTRPVPTIQTNGQGPDRTPSGPVRSGPAQAAPRGSEGAAQPAPGGSDVVRSELLDGTRKRIAESKAKFRGKENRPTVGNGRDERVDFSATLKKLTEMAGEADE